MDIKLEYISETKKAWQLPNGSWIPKSVLDGRGFEHPYYKIKDWWLTIQVENVRYDLDKLKNEFDRSDKFSEVDIENSKLVLTALRPMVVKATDIPEEIRKKYTKYWSEAYANLGCHTPDYEPRLWGNDCFEGDPLDYGQN